MRSVMLLLSLAALATSCRTANEGDVCDGWPMCKDTHTAFFCVDGNYRALNCPGADGCKDTAEQGQRVIACDIRGTVAGDQCPANYEGFIWCLTATSALRCNGLDFAAKTCPTRCQSGVGGIGSAEALGICN